MELKIKKTNPIKDLDSWFKYAEPKGGKSQWKEGRSAMEFARYMTEYKGKMPEAIHRYLESIDFKDKYTCLPEETTSFKGKDLGNGEGRHHDGLLVSKNYLIGIEAKVSESFDYSLQKKIAIAEKKNSDGGNNTRKRIVNSLKMIKPDFKEELLESKDVQKLMYQLISGTVGSIIEARERSIKKAAFLVIEFTGDVYKEKNYEEHVKKNQADYDAFLDFLELSNKPDEERYITLDNGDLRVYFNKIQVNISCVKSSYQYLIK